MVASRPGCATRAAARAGALAWEAVGRCVLVGVTLIVAGCTGAVVAPVQQVTRPAIPGPDTESEYVVDKGDTLYSIAWRHGMDYRVLAGVNSIRDPFTIYPGQRLRLPKPGDTLPPDPEPEPGEAGAEPVSAAGGTADSGVVSIAGAGTTVTPVATPMPALLPESVSSTAPPKPDPTKPEQQAAAADESPPKAPPQGSAPKQQPVAGTTANPPLPTRSAAGLQWTRPTGGKAISAFGRGGNKGIDIEGVFEQSVHAAARGRVVYAGSGLIGYGKLVIVKHSSRLLSAYAHNERLHVGEGDEVKGGQHIADMGRSGKGRVMLHFEVRRDGKPVDPLRFIP